MINRFEIKIKNVVKVIQFTRQTLHGWKKQTISLDICDFFERNHWLYFTINRAIQHINMNSAGQDKMEEAQRIIHYILEIKLLPLEIVQYIQIEREKNWFLAGSGTNAKIIHKILLYFTNHNLEPFDDS